MCARACGYFRFHPELRWIRGLSRLGSVNAAAMVFTYPTARRDDSKVSALPVCRFALLELEQDGVRAHEGRAGRRKSGKGGGGLKRNLKEFLDLVWVLSNSNLHVHTDRNINITHNFWVHFSHAPHLHWLNKHKSSRKTCPYFSLAKTPDIPAALPEIYFPPQAINFLINIWNNLNQQVNIIYGTYII